jgi:host factor-I protein
VDCAGFGTHHGSSRLPFVLLFEEDDRFGTKFGREQLKNNREPLYCCHIAGFGGSGISVAVPADLSYHTEAARLHPTSFRNEAGDRHMENKPAQNIQDTFLNTVRKDKTPITIYLVSGVKLTGKIRSFDKYSVLLENNSQEQLIFKHAISTVVAAKAAPVTHSVQVAEA